MIRRSPWSAWSQVVLTAVALAGSPLPSSAQPTRAGWTFTSELSAVISAGNSESTTLGLGANVRRDWASTVLRLEANAVRTESGKTTRTAIGSANAFELIEETQREKTAEAFNVRARFDRDLSNGIFSFSGVDWLRNTFAGVDSRFLVALGAGNTWVENDETRFKTDVAGTVTFQSDVVENPFVKRNFPGVRATYELWRRISSSAEVESELVADWNLDETEDVRLDWTHALSVSVTSVIALKPSLKLQWRNRPSLTRVRLLESDGTDTGDQVAVPLGKLDTFFRVALVVSL